MCCEFEFLGERPRLELVESPHTGGHQSHLLKVDQVVYIRLVADVKEVRILGDEGHEGDDRRGYLALQSSKHTVVTGGVLLGVEKGLK